MRWSGLLVWCALAVLPPRSAPAQVVSDPVQTARFRVGPIGITPAITLSSGVDTNVFNEPDDPKADVTTTLNPRAQIWMRLRRLLVEVQNSSDAVTFRQYSAQGGAGTQNTIRVELPINRVRLSISNAFTSTRQRASLEIDTRVRRRTNTLSAGADIRLSAKTFARLTAMRSTSAFDDDAAFLGVNLAESLNRRLESAALGLRYQLTGATTLVFSGETMRERFEFSRERDSTSVRVAPGVEFDTRAIITGRAHLGYRRFTITTGAAPPFTGPVASLELSSTIRGVIRVSVHANRDVAYSFDIKTPYYVMLGGGAAITHHLGDRWIVTAHLARQNLKYRGSSAGSPLGSERIAERTDSVNTYGGGITYLLGRNLRVGITADHARRMSGLTQRGYEGTRFLGHFGYGS